MKIDLNLEDVMVNGIWASPGEARYPGFAHVEDVRIRVEDLKDGKLKLP